MRKPTAIRSFSVCCVLAAAIASTPAQPGRAASPFREALERALAEQSAKLADLEIWEDHSTWENAWVATSLHYEVRTTHSYGLALDLANGLDAMQGYFRSVLGSTYEPAQRARVFVFPDIDAYNRFGQGINADEHSSFYGSFHASQHAERPVAAAFGPNLTWLRMQITHSAAHQWLRGAYAAPPPVWIDEGLASYFALYWHPRWGRDELRRIASDRRITPLSTLLADPISAYSNDALDRFIELGMLFNYLFHYREDTRTVEVDGAVVRAPFRDYVTALLEGRDASGLPVHALFQDPAALQRAFLTFDFDADK